MKFSIKCKKFLFLQIFFTSFLLRLFDNSLTKFDDINNCFLFYIFMIIVIEFLNKKPNIIFNIMLETYFHTSRKYLLSLNINKNSFIQSKNSSL